MRRVMKHKMGNLSSKKTLSKMEETKGKPRVANIKWKTSSTGKSTRNNKNWK